MGQCQLGAVLVKEASGDPVVTERMSAAYVHSIADCYEEQLDRDEQSAGEITIAISTAAARRTS